MRKIVLCFLLSIIYIISIGQNSSEMNNDNRKIKFGFLIGTNLITSSSGQLGFSVGNSIDIRLTKKIFFQPNFLFSFLDYKNAEKTVEMTLLEVPLHLFIKPFITRVKPTISFGPNYIFDLASSSIDWFGDLALGIEKQLKYFTIAPEVRYSYGGTMQTFYFIINFKS